ncbi:MAG: peptide deformylase, partial [Deltaproteobacteria bacterium]|nr:peptide deformylase [Deltaproteobacteria bacterium]
MAVLPIRVFPDEALRRKARPVEVVDDEIRKALADMAETMYGSAGIGLAAPQVAISRRLVVIDVPADPEAGTPGTGLIYLVNPEP